MMRSAVFLLILLTATVTVVAQAPISEFVLVAGGSFKNTKSNYYGKRAAANPYVSRAPTVASFYLGRYEVTQQQWAAVMGSIPSQFKGDTLPVDSVSWYDCIEYCNRRSRQEGLKPYYTIDKATRDPNNENEIDDIKWTVTINQGANGYRLPTEMEWEYAASGGQLSRNYTYCGSNDVETVAWYYKNSGDKPLDGYWNWPVLQQNHNRTQPVGAKHPNELGLYDMGGNVREWCWNWFGPTASQGIGPTSSKEGRVWRGGGWMGGDFCCAITWRASYEASGRGSDQGFRVCRDQ